MPFRLFFLCLLVQVLGSCSKTTSESVRIALNPWPGYEFLYLAEQQGYFELTGADVTLVQLRSLGDAQRAYVNGRVEGLASTMIEAVQAEYWGGQPLKITMVADYSNGGDIILTGVENQSLADLKGKRIGCETTSLGIYVLQKALSSIGLTLNDVSVIHLEQSEGSLAMIEGEVDAFVTYPPVSVSILKNPGFHTVFSSASIPFEILDTISIASSVLEQRPLFASKLHQAWQMALDFSRDHPLDAYEIMAAREGMSAEDFELTLSGMMVLDKAQQQSLFANPDKLQATAISVCNALVHVGTIDIQCETMPNIIYQGAL